MVHLSQFTLNSITQFPFSFRQMCIHHLPQFHPFFTNIILFSLCTMTTTDSIVALSSKWPLPNASVPNSRALAGDPQGGSTPPAGRSFCQQTFVLTISWCYIKNGDRSLPGHRWLSIHAFSKYVLPSGTWISKLKRNFTSLKTQTIWNTGFIICAQHTTLYNISVSMIFPPNDTCLHDCT